MSHFGRDLNSIRRLTLLVIKMRLLVWRIVNSKDAQVRLTFLILLTINFPEIISQVDRELIVNRTILEP